MFRVKKKNLIALALVTVLLASGIGVYQVKAAVKVNTEAKCSLTVQIPTAVSLEQHVDGKIAGGILQYDGDKQLSVKLYKIADVNESGTFTSVVKGLTAFDDGELTANEAKTLADDAYALVKENDPERTITMDPKAKSYTEKDIPVGVYLYVPSIPDTDRYSFEFTKGVISLPTSYYIQGSKTVNGDNGLVEGATKVGEDGEIVANTSDEWNYDATVAIKSQATQKWGKLKVVKNLEHYNQSLGTASFIYNIEAKYGNEVVYANVVSVDFNEPGTHESTELKLPAGTTVTITEVETGASYDVTTDKNIEKYILADEVAEAKFTNDYDDELQVGGISVVNTYSKNDDGVFKFNGNNLNKPVIADNGEVPR